MTSPIIKALERVEATAFMWQHHETGRIGFTDAQQLAAGFREINPRLKIIAPLYTADQFAAAQSAYERSAKGEQPEPEDGTAKQRGLALLAKAKATAIENAARETWNAHYFKCTPTITLGAWTMIWRKAVEWWAEPVSANAGAQAVDAEFAEDMDELCRDFYKYQEGDPRMPFSTIRPSIISVLEQWQRLRAESLKQPADSVQAERVCKCCGERIEKGSQP